MSILGRASIDTNAEQAYSKYIMNRLATDKRTAVVAALVEGTSINATCRITGVAKHTVLKLLKDLGCAAAEYHNAHVRNLKVRRVQCDEIWAFVYAKQKNVTEERMHKGARIGVGSQVDLFLLLPYALF